MNQFIDAVLELDGDEFNCADLLSHNIDKIAGIKNLCVTITFKLFMIKGQPRYYLQANIEFCNIYQIDDAAEHEDDYSAYEDFICTTTEDGIPTKEDVVRKVLELIRLLKTAKFDKMTGVFRAEDYNPFRVPELSSAEDCVVCLEPTLTRTHCDHHLCLLCWKQLKTMTCPMCREKDIKMHN